MAQKTFLSFFISLFFIYNTLTVFSQSCGSVQFGADLMSRYIWRGQNLGGESPNIQPSLKYIWNSKDSAHNITLGSWAAYNYSTSNQEVDLYLMYTLKSVLCLGLTDYYFPGNIAYTPSQNKFFNFDQETTGHVLEACLMFNGTKKIPLTFMFAMNCFGYDSKKVNDDGSQGDIFFSKYVELGYKKTVRDIDLNAFIGAALDEPDEKKGEAGYYFNKSAGIINLGIKASKSIKISQDYSLPVQASLITNPEAEKIYLVFGISF